MTRLEIDGQMLKTLLSESDCNGVDTLRERWGQRFCEARANGPSVPDRATLYRWLGGKLPRRREDLLRLCGVFDVDPLAALAFPNGYEFAMIQSLYRSFWLDSWRQPALRFLSDFFGHHVLWPPAGIAQDYFRRDWRQDEITHNPELKADYYAGFEICVDARLNDSQPQVFHFAYSQPDAFSGRWVQYGYVVRYIDHVMLVNISGDIQHCDIIDREKPLVVETWFGRALAKFRVASLHSFAMQLNQNETNLKPCVRFRA